MVSLKKRNLLLRLSLTIMMGIAISVGYLLATGAAEKVTKRNLKQKIESAATAADHKAIADYYHAEAARARGPLVLVPSTFFRRTLDSSLG